VNVEPASLRGVFILRPHPVIDDRGCFARVFCDEVLAASGIQFRTAQMNLSRNTAAHTLRGLHYQDPPHAEAKVVRCVRGRIYDCVVDLRRRSPTFLSWQGFELDAMSAAALYIPEGCAHGFLTLEAEVDVLYQMGVPYTPGFARGIRWNDPALQLACPKAPRVVSDADQTWPDFDPAKI
jgi:dTDP-4-dehydrorhamnose 3,5-epimerase